MSAAHGFEPDSPQWKARVIEDALRAGQITMASAPEWRKRLDRDPATTERQLAALAAVPSVGEANVKELDAA
jgi:hypothetical protein